MNVSKGHAQDHTPRRLIVAGSRGYTDKARAFEILDKVAADYANHGLLIEIVSGLAKGPDLFGLEWAQANDFTVHEFPADWNKYGRRAGFIRNKQMAEFGDALLALWDGKSRGTKMMIELAYEHDLGVAIITP